MPKAVGDQLGGQQAKVERRLGLLVLPDRRSLTVWRCQPSDPEPRIKSLGFLFLRREGRAIDEFQPPAIWVSPASYQDELYPSSG